MIIKNGNVVLESGEVKKDIRTENGKIAEIADNIEKSGEEVYDASGMTVLAGFIDSHTHGAAGHIYSDTVSDINKITAFEVTEGVTTVAATMISSTVKNLTTQINHLMPYIESGTVGAKIGGIHSEGPFINPLKKGAMNPENMVPPSVDDFKRLYDVCRGHLKIMTLAPELSGAADVIKEAVKCGVNISAGHTDASYDEMKRGIDAGVTRMTHTFNACRALNHREPGVLGAALTDERVSCEVICDFKHLHPAAVELIYKAKGAKGFTAISDSEFGAGLASGRLEIDGLVRIIKDGLIWLEDGKTIAGSARSIYAAFVNLLSLGVPMHEVSMMVSLNPAKALGIDKETGSIETGKWADLVVVDKELKVVQTFVNGEKQL